MSDDSRESLIFRVGLILGEIHREVHDLRREVTEAFMTVKSDLDALRQAVDDATNGIAARIDRLSQGLKNSMTDAELAAVKTGFQGEVDRLTALGQDPAQPVPPPTPPST